MPSKTGRPLTLPDYKEWARAKLTVDFDRSDAATLYALNVRAAKTAVQESPFWNEIEGLLETARNTYKRAHGAELFSSDDPVPRLLTKSYDSAIDKTFRLNVLWNRRWPDPPNDSGWITETSIYSAVDDLLRSTIVCTYLDGPGLVAENLQLAASKKGLNAIVRKLSRDEGYYAHHLYVAFTIDLATPGGGTNCQDMDVEFQITTQPQELLRHLTHPYYREQRSKPPGPRDNWQWNFRTNKFKARYLSHALHLLEAMVLEVRDNPDETTEHPADSRSEISNEPSS